ncbi:uncharacterized protein LOC124366183 [Homalodisca vitripennis]|uniref:uncharacterized protein LOC124366183 n=1 Tax=Homalodisca vitripennis TaxID=197043 RepID=UPI001EEA47C4|nr:uncharacterized protein LOC124366183 [Homalodisca vitripennis]
MIALIFGSLLVCHAALAYPNPYPGPRPAPIPDPSYVGGFPGYGRGLYDGIGLDFVGGYGGFGCVDEVITPPVVPPVLNTVDVYDIATLGVIPAPPIEYVYPAVGYEAFGLGGYEPFGLGGYEAFGLGGYPGGFNNFNLYGNVLY